MNTLFRAKDFSLCAVLPGVALAGLLSIAGPVGAGTEKVAEKKETAPPRRAEKAKQKKLSGEEREIVANMELLERLEFLVESGSGPWSSLGQAQAGGENAK